MGLGNDKGIALTRIIEVFSRHWRKKITSIGFGDSPNDFPFLQLVDTPILLGKPSKEELLSPLPERARRYETPGPKGWNQAVLDILATL
jgi:predicted mannosyl-3-phosphoglycerate phosphatase (HAD superfamily)